MRLPSFINYELGETEYRKLLSCAPLDGSLLKIGPQEESHELWEIPPTGVDG